MHAENIQTEMVAKTRLLDQVSLHSNGQINIRHALSARMSYYNGLFISTHPYTAITTTIDILLFTSSNTITLLWLLSSKLSKISLM